MVEHFTFAESVTGLGRAVDLTLSLLRFGFRTRLVTRTMAHSFTVHTVIATPPAHSTRRERGCLVAAAANSSD